MGKLERDFQADLIKEIKSEFPGSVVLKLDPNYIQGMPDLLVLQENKWATLECKKSEEDRKNPRPNQEYYVEKHNSMSFSRFIFPENKKEVLNELREFFLS